jgi:hypothetical protein
VKVGWCAGRENQLQRHLKSLGPNDFLPRAHYLSYCHYCILIIKGPGERAASLRRKFSGGRTTSAFPSTVHASGFCSAVKVFYYYFGLWPLASMPRLPWKPGPMIWNGVIFVDNIM